MDKAYKVLINKALERFHFKSSESGGKLNTVAEESLNKAIVHLCNAAFYIDDQEAFDELRDLVNTTQCGEHITPYDLTVTV
ncbi:DUF4754 family protein [Salmonella enterica]